MLQDRRVILRGVGYRLETAVLCATHESPVSLFLKKPAKIGLRRNAHGSISRQERQGVINLEVLRRQRFSESRGLARNWGAFRPQNHPAKDRPPPKRDFWRVVSEPAEAVPDNWPG
jgi:hypothetical protein